MSRAASRREMLSTSRLDHSSLADSTGSRGTAFGQVYDARVVTDGGNLAGFMRDSGVLQRRCIAQPSNLSHRQRIIQAKAPLSIAFITASRIATLIVLAA